MSGAALAGHFGYDPGVFPVQPHCRADAGAISGLDSIRRVSESGYLDAERVEKEGNSRIWKIWTFLKSGLTAARILFYIIFNLKGRLTLEKSRTAG